MYRIKTLNKIDPRGLALLGDKYEIDAGDSSEGIILRSYKMHDYDFPSELLAIARAGAGVNNIPLDKCTEKGIVVFNTPGANANGVKEAVLTGMLLVCRDFVGAINWVKEADTSELGVAKTVEKNKSTFKGGEISGKTMGVIGLGAIGILVANMAHSLGMTVVGYDPYLSEENANRLNSEVRVEKDLDAIYKQADFISLHLPLLDSTKGFVSAAAFAKMKSEAVLLNFARGGLVDEVELKKVLADGKIAKYVTDFPSEEVLGVEGVIAIPHLGASTNESETNCAVMAANEMKDFLENGNVKNSVNIPDCSLGEFKAKTRLTVLAKDEQKSEIEKALPLALASATKSEKGLFYGIYDFENKLGESDVEKLDSLDGLLRLRILFGA